MNENQQENENVTQATPEEPKNNTGAVATITLDNMSASGQNAEVNNDWLYADGIKGEGEKPEWFLSDKYKTIMAQAKAYHDAQKIIGNKVNAPEKYELSLTEENKSIDFNQDDEFFKYFTQVAKENNFSQEKYNEVLNKFVSYQKSQTESFLNAFDEESKEIYKNAGLDADKAKEQATNYLINILGEEQKDFVNDLLVDPYNVKAFSMLIKAQDKTIPTPEITPQVKDKQYFMNKMKDKRYAYDMKYTQEVDNEMANAINNNMYKK